MSTTEFATKSFDYSIGQAALVVIDLTKHITRGGSFDRVLRERGVDPSAFFDRIDNVVVPNTVRLLERFRHSAAAVVFTRVLIESDEALDWPPAYRRDVLSLGLAPSRPGMSDFELLDELGWAPTEQAVGKRSVSAFCGSDLSRHLRDQGVGHVVLTGCTTNFGVGISAIDAANQGFEVTIVDDACAALSSSAHEEWLSAHGLFFERLSTDAAIDRLSR